MEKITRERFMEWAEYHHWLFLGEQSTPEGRQTMYLTPSGAVQVQQFDLEGNCVRLGPPMPPPGSQIMPQSRPQKFPPPGKSMRNEA